MHESGALQNRRVLLLGDDDLISVTIDRMARHYRLGRWVKELVVVDVDQAVLDYCRSRLRNAPFPRLFVRHDLRAPLPPELEGRFDTVLSDPPYTSQAAELFLSRAAAALDGTTGGNVFLCFGMKTPQSSLRVQSAIWSMGFVIRELIRNFNEYLGAGALGGTSHLYHLTSTVLTRPLIDSEHAGTLYTGDRVTARRYRCIGCGAVGEVGVDHPNKTVQELMARGCPGCDGRSFRPLPRAAGGTHFAGRRTGAL